MEYSYNYSNNYTPQPPRDKKPMGAGAIIAICTVIAIIAGVIGGVVGYLVSGTGDVMLGSTAVIYRDVDVRSLDGSKIEGELTVGQVADMTRDSVVEITTEAVSTGSFMMQYVSEGAGSGVILTEDGYIVTNHHVIEGATTISVRTTDGTVYEKATLIGTDERTDLAIIKIEAQGLKSAVVGDFEQCKVGDKVVAIGNPLGQLGGTVTDGIISATDREITIDNNIMTLIQTNTAINPGNSGGGLFNMSGQLIGIVNAKSSGEDVEGLGFAIPVNLAQTVIEDLIEYGYVTGRIDTGIEVLEINDFQSAMYYRVNTAGLYVYSVREGSSAQLAGLQSGDLIKKLGATDITTEDDYNKAIESYGVGDTLEFTVVRGGKEKIVSFILSEYKPK